MPALLKRSNGCVAITWVGNSRRWSRVDGTGKSPFSLHHESQSKSACLLSAKPKGTRKPRIDALRQKLCLKVEECGTLNLEFRDAE